MWLAKLRKTNGPHFTWPLLMFSSALPERLMYKMGKLYEGTPLRIKTRADCWRPSNPNYWKFLREDNGDLPTNGGTRAPAQSSVQADARPVAG